MPNDRDQRLRLREEIEQERMERIWPGTCPTCLAPPGERCSSRSGGRVVRHRGRLRHEDVETIQHVDDLAKYPALFLPGKTLGECMEVRGYESRHANWWCMPSSVRLNSTVGDSWQLYVAGDPKEGLHGVGPDYVIPHVEPADGDA